MSFSVIGTEGKVYTNRKSVALWSAVTSSASSAQKKAETKGKENCAPKVELPKKSAEKEATIRIEKASQSPQKQLLQTKQITEPKKSIQDPPLSEAITVTDFSPLQHLDPAKVRQNSVSGPSISSDSSLDPLAIDSKLESDSSTDSSAQIETEKAAKTNIKEEVNNEAQSSSTEEIDSSGDDHEEEIQKSENEEMPFNEEEEKMHSQEGIEIIRESTLSFSKLPDYYVDMRTQQTIAPVRVQPVYLMPMPQGQIPMHHIHQPQIHTQNQYPFPIYAVQMPPQPVYIMPGKHLESTVNGQLNVNSYPSYGYQMQPQMIPQYVMPQYYYPQQQMAAPQVSIASAFQ